MTKRIFDIASSVVVLFLCGPLFLVVAILIKVDSRGPVLFKQIRMGRGGRPFFIYKFRTMVQDAPQRGGKITIGEDVRITRIGRTLRQYKLDELPQLLNILKGDMSVVGPRPEVPEYVELYREDFEAILSVRPGLTDLASLRYIDEPGILKRAVSPEEEYRTIILPEKIRLAKLYIQHSSLTLDTALIAQTVLCLMRVPLVVCDLPECQPSKRKPGSNIGAGIKTQIMKRRRFLIVVLDIVLIVLANYLAFWLRFDGTIPQYQVYVFVQVLPWLVVIRGAAFLMLRLNEGLWRYTSVWDLQRIVAGVLLSTLALYGLIHWGQGMRDYPRSIFIIDSLLLIGFMTGIRLSSRLLRERAIYGKRKKVLIIGAGDSGERIVREMKGHASYRYEPIGFVDDQESLLWQRIHGVKVLGTRKDLARIVGEQQPDEVMLALQSPRPELLREIVATLGPFKVSIKMLPNLKELLSDKTALSQIRNVSLGDLLPRATIDLKGQVVTHMIRGKRVLITGAGGSIGSELSRQIALLQPESLILYERHENSLYTVAKELGDQGMSGLIHPVIGDVTDRRRLWSVLNRHRPSIIFHAAAHKHVPLVELNPAEALKNNCIGTRIIAEAADQFGVDRFVLVSTDKAVNPSSVMGATKRVAELIVQDIARRSSTRFLTVRFGNVLGSNGSVVLRFQEQIQAGGPVTVTHPSVKRYFMLIPEAVHLVLQAASLGEQGGIYVLDMGQQIKVLDLAKNLIRLSGFVPGKEIPIQFVGLRPGEKLYEELVADDELAEPSGIERIVQLRTVRPSHHASFEEKISALEQADLLNNASWAIDRLRELVPTFRSSSHPLVVSQQAPAVLVDDDILSVERS